MNFRASLLGLGVCAVTLCGTAYSASSARLALPAEWSMSPLTAPTLTMGLKVSSFIINEPEQVIRDWRQQHMADCRLPAASEQDDWHCVDEHHIYSLLLREEGYIWVLSERVEQPSPGAGEHVLPATLINLNAEVLSHSATPFESVTLLHSRRSLYGLQHDLVRLYTAQGSRLTLHEQDAGGFILQWQDAEDRVTYTAQKDEHGDVLLVKVRGTNL